MGLGLIIQWWTSYLAVRFQRILLDVARCSIMKTSHENVLMMELSTQASGWAKRCTEGVHWSILGMALTWVNLATTKPRGRAKLQKQTGISMRGSSTACLNMAEVH